MSTKSTWFEHVAACRISGLSVKAYSREHNLKYDTFLYHYRKSHPKSKKQKSLIPIRVSEPALTVVANNNRALCALITRGGSRLEIYDESILCRVLSVLS